MPTASPLPIPGTPRVISPSPDPERRDTATEAEGYFANGTGQPPNAQPQAKKPDTIRKNSKKVDYSAEPEFRARSRSRDDNASVRRRRTSALVPLAEDVHDAISTQPMPVAQQKTGFLTVPNGYATSHSSPANTVASYWREFSRSPSPLGLIPIHREWRSFVHRHEIPRKGLHVSIGFLAFIFYSHGFQSQDFIPLFIGLLVPITLVDILRHNWPPFNRVYIRIMGAFMRESEAHEKYNGVIWYIAGTLTCLVLFSKDISVMCICLLSWCDTAASTFGRLYGRYTPRIRRGKSLAGSLAAFIFGVATALLFWGWAGPHYEALGVADNTGKNAFAFQGRLSLPRFLNQNSSSDFTKNKGVISGWPALVIMSLWSGFIASASEAIDIFGLDDNITIPILCGVGLWGFLKIFGAA